MNLTARSSHFEFGENWREYAKTIDQARIDAAVIGLKKLFPEGSPKPDFSISAAVPEFIHWRL